MILKLLCGIVLAYGMIQPIKQLKLTEVGELFADFKDEAYQAAQFGKDTSISAWMDSITQGTEAYILEKAKGMNLDLAVEVELSDDEIPIPIAVTLIGDAAPYAKKVLTDLIVQELEIPKENQKWISQ